jgi:hypothetical protein
MFTLARRSTLSWVSWAEFTPFIFAILFNITLQSSEDELQYNVMKSNQVLQSYDVKISKDKTKAMTMEGRQIVVVVVVVVVYLTTLFQQLRLYSVDF